MELFRLSNGAVVADTPGFSSFDAELEQELGIEELPQAFREFRPYLGQCRFIGCAHVKEKGCAVREAPSRHASYVRLYQQAREVRPWEQKQNK